MLSPFLFNLFSEFKFQKSLEDTCSGVTVNGHLLNNIRYADDAVVLINNPNDFQQLMNIITAEGER